MAPPFTRGRGGGRGRGGRGGGRGGHASGGRQKTSTTVLPQALSQEMENASSRFFENGDDRDFSKKFKNKAASRKLRRKQERADKKKGRPKTLSKIELLRRQQHMEPISQGATVSKNSKKRKLGSQLEVNLDEHDGETLVTAIANDSKEKAKKKHKGKDSDKGGKPTMNSDELDARRLEKLAKTNPAFYAMLQEDGMVAGDKAGSAMSAAMDEDEQYIRHYEKMLGFKRKDSGKVAAKKMFMEDGLGDLLDGIELGSRGKTGVEAARKELARASQKGKSASVSGSVDKKRKAKDIQSESEEDDEDSFDEELEGVDPDDLEDSDMDELDDMEGSENEGDEDDDGLDELIAGLEGDYSDEDDEDDDLLDDEELDDEELEEDFEDEDEDEEGAESDTEMKSAGKSSSDSASTTPASAASTGKYLPPHLRAAAAAAAAASASEGGAAALAKAIPRQNTEELLRLRRQLQGLLNKLSESNIEAILLDIEGLYRKYPRADVTETITDMILASISSKANLLDSFVILYATVVASLYRLVGIEFAAHFVQTLIEQFDKHHSFASSTKSTEMTDETLSAVKQCTNLIVLVSELYNMQVVACVLVYELIRWFMTELSELNVELVVKIVKTSGYQLRQDDPTTLKTIVQEFTVLSNGVSGKANSSGSSPITSRTKYLLETLTALKANRMKGPTTNSTTSGTIAESTTRMKKFLSGLSRKRTTFPSEPMRVGLTDIRQVGTKGKWWLVGSSWKNNMVGEENSRQQSYTTTTADDLLEAENELIKLAKKNKMNTDIRRSIFVVLMSSEDFMDAFERLLKLGLKEVQQREIVRVLLHCAGNEKIYNPYYTLVGQRLCQHDHSVKITFQYALWDLLREMGATDVGGMEKVKGGQVIGLDDGVDGDKKVPLRKIVNLSKMYSFLISSHDLSLVMLKTVTFTSLPEQPTLFFQLLMTNIILSSQPQLHSPLQQEQASKSKGGSSKEKAKLNAQALADIFIRAAVNPTLAQGIIFFLQAFVKKGQVCQTEQEKETVRWGCTTVREILSSAVKTGGRF